MASPDPHAGPIPSFLVIAAILLALSTGCRKETVQVEPLGPDTIAAVGSVPLKTEAFRELMRQRNGRGTNHFAQLEQKQALLGELIDREALYAKAKAAGLLDRPDIQEAIKGLLVSRFQEEQLSKAGDVAVTEAEAQDYYRAHQDRYETPGRVHAAAILVRAPAKASPEKRAELQAKAESALAQARVAATPEEFARVVLASSDDQTTRYRGGDLGWVTRSAPPWGMEPAAVKALFALQAPGEFSPVIPTDKGFYILRLLEAQPPAVRPLAEVREAVRSALFRQKAEQRQKEFRAAIRSGLTLRTNLQVLQTVEPPVRPDSGNPPRLPGAIAETR